MDESTQYMFFFSSLALSIVVGLFLLIRYWEHKIIRLAGLYTIKPIFVLLFGALIPFSIIYDYQQYHPIVGVEIILSIAIVYISW
ncbi:MAG: hypothetical protein MUO77_20245, partial [Anaerolineales bacterium]|nr:hypothetical protein [Anaerolineales bacterium]